MVGSSRGFTQPGSACLSSTTCGRKAEGKPQCYELAEVWIRLLGQENCCSWISSCPCWVPHVQECPGGTGGSGQGTKINLVCPWGMAIIPLQLFFTPPPHFLAFSLLRSSKPRPQGKISWLCQCQELFVPHLPALHGLAAAPVHSVKLFPALFQLERQIITPDKLSRIQNSTKGDTWYSLACQIFHHDPTYLLLI